MATITPNNSAVPAKNTMLIAKINAIHSGDNTHNYDQSMLPVNFRPINKIVSKPANSIPPELDSFI